MPRKKSDTVSLMVRMKEPLRASIEKAAKKRGVSLNAEIVGRIERSLIEEEVSATFIEDPRLTSIIRDFLDAKRLIERHRKKSMLEDIETFIAIKEALVTLLQGAAPEPDIDFERRTSRHKKRFGQWKGSLGLLSTGPPKPNPGLSPTADAQSLGRAAAEVLLRQKLTALEQALLETREKARQEQEMEIQNMPEQIK